MISSTDCATTLVTGITTAAVATVNAMMALEHIKLDTIIPPPHSRDVPLDTFIADSPSERKCWRTGNHYKVIDEVLNRRKKVRDIRLKCAASVTR